MRRTHVFVPFSLVARGAKCQSGRNAGAANRIMSLRAALILVCLSTLPVTGWAARTQPVPEGSRPTLTALPGGKRGNPHAGGRSERSPLRNPGQLRRKNSPAKPLLALVSPAQGSAGPPEGPRAATAAGARTAATRAKVHQAGSSSPGIPLSEFVPDPLRDRSPSLMRDLRATHGNAQKEGQTRILVVRPSGRMLAKKTRGLSAGGDHVIDFAPVPVTYAVTPEGRVTRGTVARVRIIRGQIFLMSP